MDEKSVRALLLELITSMFPSLVLGGVHRYTVSRDNGDGRFDLAPAPKVLHPPRLRVEQWSAPGIEGGFVVGQEILVVFLDNDAERPAIIGHLPLRRGKPGSLKIDCTGTLRAGASASLVHLGSGSESLLGGLEVGRVVRYGDPVQLTVAGGLALGPIMGLPPPAVNLVAKVKA